MEDEKLRDEILDLKKKRNAIILAHNYQLPEVQEVADFVGDSLGLSRSAAQTDAEVIVFCGVHFMAETAAILSPHKKVLLPAPDAGCPMADMITPAELMAKKSAFPGVPVVCYVNSSAAVKAVSDYACTSANAVEVVQSISQDTVIFVPDKNLAAYVASKTGKNIIAWPGFCPSHHRITRQDLLRVKNSAPEAKVVVHPECRPEVIALADQVTSTEGMLTYVRTSPADTFIIGTEVGILHRLQTENPGKRFLLASPSLVCPNMKKISLQDIVKSLHEMAPQITVPPDIAAKARDTLDRMIAA